MKPTAPQLKHLRNLAERTGQTFAYPATAAEASAEITRLQDAPRTSRADRHREKREIQHAMATERGEAARVRGHELTGYGSSAQWVGERPECATVAKSAPKVGKRTELARYTISDGERIVYGQRIDGVVRVTDRPADDEGRSYLVERGLTSRAELDALVADYVETSQRRDTPGAEVA
jgi:hypothetical protein